MLYAITGLKISFVIPKTSLYRVSLKAYAPG